MPNQGLLDPETEIASVKSEETQLWSAIGQEPSYWEAFCANLRDAFFPAKLPPLELTSKPVPVADPLAQEPLWAEIWHDLREVFFPPKLPPLELQSHEVAVRDLMATPRDRQASLIAGGVHVALLAAIVIFSIWHPKRAVVQPPPVKVSTVTPFLPFTAKMLGEMGGGGGGGDHDLLMASKGKLPQIAKTQFVPPEEIIRNDHPKLAVAPTVVVPQEVQLPNANMPNLGDPTTMVRGPASNGIGARGGIGSGQSGGIGSGSGAGVGPGEGGGYGGGVMQVGNGVQPPKLIYSVDPEFSDEARKAKFQGTSVVSLVVDPQGMPQDIQILRALGMGLDEKAVEAVKQYRFKPAMYHGKPVAVQIDVVVDFHIY
jgi:protein TonB